VDARIKSGHDGLYETPAIGDTERAACNAGKRTMYDGPIVDSHHHIWEWKNYPWLVAPITPKMYGSDYQPLRQDYLVEDLLKDFGDNNVVKSVHVQANYDPSDPVGETKWLQAQADRTGFPHAIVGHAVMTAPDLDEVLAGHAGYANTRGVRHQLHYWEGDRLRCRTDRPDLCITDEFQRGIEKLRSYKMSFEVQGFSHQFKYFAELIRNFPDIDFCLVHAGMLTADDDATVAAWKEGLEHLHPLKNLWIKCSGLNFFTAKCDENHMRITLDHLLDRFGADRCFYGSNFPLEKLWASYDDLIATTKRIVERHSPADQRKYFHDTATAFYRI
jgi:predicted TIM-barrel fold metal-dependent hydrolase